METISIGFTRPKAWFNPFSWLIRLVEWTPYSHAYIRFKLEDKDIVFQASGLKINFIEWEKFAVIEHICKEFQVSISDDSKQRLIEYAIDELGIPYEIKGLFGLPIVLICRLFGKKIANPFASQNRTAFCSKLATMVLENFVDPTLELDPDTALPKDVYEYLEKYEMKNGSM